MRTSGRVGRSRRSSMPEPLLSLEGVYCGYGGGDVLQGLDLEVERGSITCIVGPNGAGKPTVLRAVSGLLRPRAGVVRFDGIETTHDDCAAILGRGVVQVPQSNGVFPPMTERENAMQI